jgi:hypothetical protein
MIFGHCQHDQNRTFDRPSLPQSINHFLMLECFVDVCMLKALEYAVDQVVVHLTTECCCDIAAMFA